MTNLDRLRQELPNEISRLLTTKEVAVYLGVPEDTLYQWRHREKGPKSIKVGRHLRYRAQDLDAWLNENSASVR